MAEYQGREAFIPYRRTDLIELCIEDGLLSGDEAEQFRRFCEILAAYYHYRSQATIEALKDAFAPYNPDCDTRVLRNYDEAALARCEAILVQAFEQVLQRANYIPLSHDELQEAFRSESLIPVKTSVDFNDYERIICYYRGDNFITVSRKRWLRRIDLEVDNLQRVALLLKFKDEAYFQAKGVKRDRLNFTPGKLYLYLYKNIPRHDLELLFPNVNIHMSWKDRLLFGIPAIGAAIPLLLKILPSLGLIIGALLLLLLGPEVAANIVPEIHSSAHLYTILAATLSVGMTLGGFAVKQYNTYKNKRLKFLKQVTDTLFFKNLVTNQGVLHTLVDAADEEECKEIILAYYHLLTARRPLTREQLDDRIEQWMEERFAVQVDFDIAKTLQNMQALCAPNEEYGRHKISDGERKLLHIDEQGRCRVLELHRALALIDYIWDHVFQYTDRAVAQLAPALAERQKGMPDSA
ncbi:MAG: hypothetical protein KatS3mg057_3126 [Herpetosiphonaceae bacterium]|nr:MAG: hypothetical protein KatS3mg057_3126 [Herpetosiphonaceae bacterium]